MRDCELFEEVARWLPFAREDLRVGEMILEHGQVPRAACFHAQQCAEKAIKGSLIFLRIPFRKVHDLEVLCKELPEGWILAEDPSRLSALSIWAVESRYPGDLPEATEEEARAVYETTLRDLKKHGYTPPNEGDV